MPVKELPLLLFALLQFACISSVSVYPYHASAAITAPESDQEEDSSDDSEDDDDELFDEVDVDSSAGNSWKAIIEQEDEIGYAQTLIVNNPPIYSLQSSLQHIDVYNSDHYGKVFVLDDCLQLTERDAPQYNEMLAHVPIMEYLARRSSINRNNGNDEPMRVLVVGGGDGYVVSELLKYPQIGTIDHVELDDDVVHMSKQHFPWATEVWDNDRVNLVIGDGAKFVTDQAANANANTNNRNGYYYHAIIQDASDPYWLAEDGTVHTLPSSVLYDEMHFRNLYKLLKPHEGVLMMQAETYNIPSNLDSIRRWRNMLQDIGFEKPRYGGIAIGTFPTGQIGFFVAHAARKSVAGREGEERVCESDDCDDSNGKYKMDNNLSVVNWNRIVDQYNQLSGETLFYHPRVHRSAFDLPLWVEETIYRKDAIVLGLADERLTVNKEMKKSLRRGV